MTDRAADDGVGDSTTNRQRKAAAAALHRCRQRPPLSLSTSLTSLLLSSISLTDADRGEEDGRHDCPAATGAADGTTSVTDAPAIAAAAPAARARKRYLQLAGEKHTRYYLAAVLSSSAPSAVVVPSRDGYLRSVCPQQSQDGG